MKTKMILMSAMISILLVACGKTNNNANLALGQGGIGTTYPGGCAPLSGQIGFSAQGASLNDIAVLVGNMPATSHRPGTYGQVALGSYGYAGGYGYGSPGTITLNKSGMQGSLSMQVVSPGYQSGNVNFPGAQAQVNGMIQLSPQVLQALQYSAGYLSMPFAGSYNYYPQGQIVPYNNAYAGYGYSPYSMAGCISSVAFEAVVQFAPNYTGMPTSGVIYQVLMYLYMNNSANPTAIVL